MNSQTKSFEQIDVTTNDRKYRVIAYGHMPGDLMLLRVDLCVDQLISHQNPSEIERAIRSLAESIQVNHRKAHGLIDRAERQVYLTLGLAIVIIGYSVIKLISCL